MEDKVTFSLNRNIANGLIWLFNLFSGLVFFFCEKEDQKIRHKSIQAIVIGVMLIVLTLISYMPILGFLARILRWFILIGVLGLSVLSFMGNDLDVPILSKFADNIAK